MRNFWLVARHEYLKMVARRGFLVGVLGIPLALIAIMGVTIFVTLAGEDDRQVGIVDQAGVIVSYDLPDADFEWIPFPDEASARLALEPKDAGRESSVPMVESEDAGIGSDVPPVEIQAYYVFPPEFKAERQVRLYYWDEYPDEDIQEEFDQLLRYNLAADLDPGVRTRLLEGAYVTIRSMDGVREIGDKNVLGFLLPMIASIVFLFVVMTSAGYLLQVVTAEKENRTIEILLTSLSPEQLIGGKALGLMGVAFTQLVIWLLTIAVGGLVAARIFDWELKLNLPLGYILGVALFFISSYALIAGMMTAIGGAVTEMKQAQQVAGLLNFLFMAPLFLITMMSESNNPLVLLLTFFPTTSFVTFSMRWVIGVIPLWQVVTSWLILTGTALFSIWASARIFRAGMLRYGQRLDLSDMFSALRREEGNHA